MLWSNYVSSANRNFGAHLQLYLHVHDRKEAAMFSDMIVPIFQWWMLVAHSSTTFVI
jgi:hypothetical protein